MSLVASVALMAGVATGPAVFVSSTLWPSEPGEIGGLSGVETDETGTRFVALSDRAHLISGRFIRDAGRITVIEIDRIDPVLNRRGQVFPLPVRDSEGIAFLPDGTMAISFEAHHRVMTYARVGGRATALPRHPDFNDMHGNASLEALAADHDGTLYTVPEQTVSRIGPFPVYRLREGAWTRPFTITRRGGFYPVGADFGPDGLFYLLERRVGGLLGFRSRVRRFHISGDAIGNEDVLFETPAGRHGNLEGLAVWRDSDGRIRLTMVADNNFNRVQRNEVVEYLLP